MDIEDKLLIMIGLLNRNNEKIGKHEIKKRFFRFFNEEVSDLQVSLAIENLQDDGYIDFDLSTTQSGLVSSLEKHIAYYFNDGIVKVNTSSAEMHYRQLNILNIENESIIDKPQLDYIISEIGNTDGSILDLGCGRGGITEYISKIFSRQIFGIDNSNMMLGIAKKRNTNIKWILLDIEKADKINESFGCIILIDSIYFIKDKTELLKMLDRMLISNGKIIITYSEYAKEPILKSTKFEQLLTNEEYQYKSVEFTSNEIAIWEDKGRRLNSCISEYLEENNEFIVYDKMIEGKKLLKKLKENRGRRLILTINKKT